MTKPPCYVEGQGDCPDRVVSPNCHDRCEKYKEWVREREKAKEAKRKYLAVEDVLATQGERVKKAKLMDYMDKYRRERRK